MNTKGFVLAETLVVVLFVLIIFTLMYNSMVPLLGRYDEISLYDDLDTTYDVYQYRNLIERDSNVRDIATTHYKIVTCNDLTTNKDKCNQLNEFLDVKEGDRLVYINANYIDDVIKDENVGEEIRDYLNYVKVDPDKCIILLDHNGYISYVESIEYKIEYDLRGGTIELENPTKYYMGTDTFTLNNPTKTGYTFLGWTGSNGDTPQLTVTVEKGSVGDRNYIANWRANEIYFSGKTINRTYGDATSDIEFDEATNGTGYYIYTEKSETNSGGAATDYISVSHTKITIQNSIPAGTYTYVVTARDADSGSVKDGTFTISVAKASSSITCQVAQTYTGGAIQSYTSSSGCNPVSNVSPTDAGTYTVTCNGDSNHNNSTCSFTINKAGSSISCNSPQTYTGGAIQSYTSSSGCASVTNGSVVNAGDYSVVCNGDGNHNSSSCGFKVLVAWTWKAYYHNTSGYDSPYTNHAVLNRGDGPQANQGAPVKCNNNCPGFCNKRGFNHAYCNDFLNTDPNVLNRSGGHCWCGRG